MVLPGDDVEDASFESEAETLAELVVVDDSVEGIADISVELIEVEVVEVASVEGVVSPSTVVGAVDAFDIDAPDVP